MKRKLFSTLLCAFALLLLMGAGVEQDSAAAAIVIEEESASADGSAQVLETGIQTGIEAQDTEEISGDEIYLEAINPDGTQTSVTAEPAVALDHTLLVNGSPSPRTRERLWSRGPTYVALAAHGSDPGPQRDHHLGWGLQHRCGPERRSGPDGQGGPAVSGGQRPLSLCPRGRPHGGRAG